MVPLSRPAADGRDSLKWLLPAIWAVMGASLVVICVFLLILSRAVFVFLSAAEIFVALRLMGIAFGWRQALALRERAVPSGPAAVA